MKAHQGRIVAPHAPRGITRRDFSSFTSQRATLPYTIAARSTQERIAVQRAPERMGTSVIGSAVATVLMADFFSGAVHWAEDAYARKDTPLIGKWIGQANIEHHVKPRAFVARSWWASSWDLALASALIVGGAWWLDKLNWQVWLFAIVAANANQIHKWAHRAPHENGRIVTCLQRFKLIQTQRHHAKHHSGKKNSHYCSITNFLNPILEELEFWDKLERMNARVFGLRRKPDPTVQA